MADKALLPADQLISCIGGSSTDCVKVVDKDGMILSFNDYGYTLMEIDRPDQVIGKNWLDFWSGNFGKTAHNEFDKALFGTLGYFEGYCPTLKGTPKWWQVTIIPLKNTHNEIEWILSISRDISELHELRDIVSKLKKTAYSNNLSQADQIIL